MKLIIPYIDNYERSSMLNEGYWYLSIFLDFKLLHRKEIYPFSILFSIIGQILKIPVHQNFELLAHSFWYLCMFHSKTYSYVFLATKYSKTQTKN